MVMIRSASEPANIAPPAAASPPALPPAAASPLDLHPEAFHGDYKLIGPTTPERFVVQPGMLTDIATSAFPALMRAGSGALAYGYQVSLPEDDKDEMKYAVARAGGRLVKETSEVGGFKRPELPLKLYEFEGCPFCKKVREAVSILDLEINVYPCPRDSTTWRPEAVALGGKSQFPFLVDPNNGKQMYESDDIIRYLFTEYGPGEDKIPFMLKAGPLTTITCALGMATRVGYGNKARKSRQPSLPLRFWGYEASPFVKVAREVLTELELPYLYISTARGSPRRQEMLDKYGRFQVPFLEDPNKGVCLFESKDIVEYLNKTYAA